MDYGRISPRSDESHGAAGSNNRAYDEPDVLGASVTADGYTNPSEDFDDNGAGDASLGGSASSEEDTTSTRIASGFELNASFQSAVETVMQSFRDFGKGDDSLRSFSR